MSQSYFKEFFDIYSEYYRSCDAPFLAAPDVSFSEYFSRMFHRLIIYSRANTNN
jgi:hypothetical protein